MYIMDKSSTQPFIYHATITFVSRGQRRGGYQWSTVRVKERLLRLGFTCKPAVPTHTLLQEVSLIGTRDEIIRDRKEITSLLRIMSGSRMGIKFKLKEPLQPS